jgi:hypothetical protein
VDGLWELVVDHERRCGYARIGEMVSMLKKRSDQCLIDDMSEIVHYDNNLRQLMVEKGLITADMLDFLFGRPLEQTIVMFGLRSFRKGGKLIFRCSGRPISTPDD